MRLTHYLAAAALAAALPATAAAQQPAPPPPTTVPPQVATTYNGPLPNRWTVSGFVGSNFNTSFSDIELNEGTSVAFGGQVSYLFGGTVGAEFLVDFAPNFNTTSLAFANDPQVNSYMANVMAAVPLWGGEVQPFFSGGVGGIQLRGDVLNLAFNASGGATEISRMKFGANVGGGLMAFAGPVGFRADIRFYHTSTDANLTSVGVADRLAETLLSGLKFWRANVGVAFQW